MFDAKILALVLASACGALAAGDVAEQAKQRNEAYGDELEQYFRDYLVTQYPERAAKAWHRSYENQEAFLKSVEPNRQRYRRMFAPPDLKPTGPARAQASARRTRGEGRMDHACRSARSKPKRCW